MLESHFHNHSLYTFFHEKEAGSDAANLSTVATKQGNDYILNGHKAWYEY